MNTSIQTLQKEATTTLSKITTSAELDTFEISYLGRKGKINTLFDELSLQPKDKKKEWGKDVNTLKQLIQKQIEIRRKRISIGSIDKQLLKRKDMTVPGIQPPIGHIHPISLILEELTQVFELMDYDIIEGPEIETEYYNFETLNIPKNHPARDLQDTFWLTNGLLPRTHTSSMQVRAMEVRKPPFKIAVPGWVFRSEREDATHASSFHHYEGFVVGEDISFSDLKGTLYTFLRYLLGNDIELKFRASYFPYVEPCAEISVSCPQCKAKGCKACGGSGWLEVMGSGMIHPTVLKNAYIDPAKYSGFAYVFGVTRLAMIKYQINDVRLFTGSDMRFLKQF